MQKIGIVTASVFMIAAVGLGAFGAHGLKHVLSDLELAIFKTAVFYHFIHSLAIFLVFILSKLYDLPKLEKSFYFFSLGILLFSGSLYLISTQNLHGFSIQILGPATPLGGLSFMIGWFLIAWSFIKSKKV